MLTRPWEGYVVGALVALLLGCEGPTCVEGSTRLCDCPSGSSAVLVCNADGRYPACPCGAGGGVGPICDVLLTDVLDGVNDELDSRRATEGAVVPPRLDLSSCSGGVPPVDSFVGRYCDAGLEFAGQLDAQVASALAVCWLAQCGHATAADAESAASDAIANYYALYEAGSCAGIPRCMFYGTAPGCGPCSDSTACPNVTYELGDRLP